MNKQPVKQEYINLYDSGKTIWEISEIVNDSYKNVFESIFGHRFEARLLPYEEKEKIKNLYLSGKQTVYISKLYGVNNHPISAVLNEFDIKRNQGKMIRKYNVDEYYFDNINTPNKAYCLGFLAADGCNMPEKQTISMSLEECDKEILEKICFEMKNEHPLEFIDYSNKHDFGYSYKNQYRMLIFSSHMCKSLKNIGIVPAKSNVLKYPDVIPKDLHRHFIRGLFDGDGSIGYKDREQLLSRNIRYAISIVSTNSVCTQLNNTIYREIGVGGSVTFARNNNGITSTYAITKKKDVMKFLDWIYSEADLKLNRKYEVYSLLKQNYNNDLCDSNEITK